MLLLQWCILEFLLFFFFHHHRRPPPTTHSPYFFFFFFFIIHPHQQPGGTFLSSVFFNFEVETFFIERIFTNEDISNSFRFIAFVLRKAYRGIRTTERFG